MSDATTGQTSWDETMRELQRDSRDCGALLVGLAASELRADAHVRKRVWCMGRGKRSMRHDRFAWQYWTRRAGQL